MYELLKKVNQEKDGARRTDLRNILGTDRQLVNWVDKFAVAEGILRQETKYHGKKVIKLYFKTDQGEWLFEGYLLSWNALINVARLGGKRLKQKYELQYR